MYNYIGEIAKGLNYLCFILSVFSIFSYLKSIEDKKWQKFGYYRFNGVTIGIIIMFFSLLFLIIKHQYQYTYVFHNSSNDLSTGLLISSSFAGQEGSFLLWVFFLSIIGIFLLSFVRKYDCESHVMGIYIIIIAFLLLLIIVKSPFEKVWETFPESIRTGEIPKTGDIIYLGINKYFIIPPDGNGLNPLLQNFWMQIHPPILFLGFALMAVPFSYAISALLRKEYKNWINQAIPWILLASTILACGIILGGFWAYETLGWGGYWGWDPVENSSLIPWLISVALIHTTFNQRRTGGFIKTNIFLAIIGFILIIYSTFLTRSGVLSDSSVHSFTEPGTIVYLVLFLFLAAFIILGFGLFSLRLKDFPDIKAGYKSLSRETVLSFGSIILILSAVIILVGTSYPIFVKSRVETVFYNNWNLPLMIIMIFLNGASLILLWKENRIKDVIKKGLISFIISIILSMITFFYGVKDLMMILLIWSSFFSLIINLNKLIKVIPGKIKKSGAFISHIGIALILLGIIGSGRYSKTENIHLPLNKSVGAFDYYFTYLGEEKFEDGKKSYFNVKIEKDNESEILKPVMYISSRNNGVMKIPDIKSTLFKDIYFSPAGLEASNSTNPEELVELEKDKQIFWGDYKIVFISHDFMGKSMNDMMTGSSFIINVKIKIENKSGKKEEINLTTKYEKDGNEINFVKSEDKSLEIGLVKVKSNSTSGVTAVISIKKSSQFNKSDEEILIAEVSIKPFIIVFWAGNLIMMLGFLISFIRRITEI
jgi:cytochrome c-type biogenesis protein CcmF